MGLVYLAYDPELDRKVALKVLHPGRSHDTRSRQRLTMEARALAKLGHPNVVAVHDVIVEDGQVVIVMELLEGQTLASWEHDARRSWREVVAVYAQAGAGLAAAHGLDIIHRDFKPSNAIIGADGRVRVLDFGLARLIAEASAAGRAGERGEHVGLTTTGDVVGTLAYSAPEQLDGGAVTAASDQFSFCVSLHGAVEGVAPFDGATPLARLTGIRARRIQRASDGRRVPAWLRAVIGRGLSADPARRHATMADVLAELGRPRGWRRWRFAVLAALIIGASVAASLMVRPPATGAVCDGGAAQIARSWSAAQRDGIARAIDAVGVPYASNVRDRVLATLDRYQAEWRDTHRVACVAHQQGVISSLLLDRQMACLGRRLGDLRAASDVLARTDGSSLANVMDVAAQIPQVSWCADLERLQAEIALPESPALRRQVESVRARISVAEALARAGRSEQALATAVEASDRARGTGYPPVEIEAALAEGRIKMQERDLDAARAVLLPARAAALEQHMFAAAVEASARCGRLRSPVPVEDVARDREQVGAKAALLPERLASLEALQEALLDEVIDLAAGLVLEESVERPEIAPEQGLAGGAVAGTPSLEQVQVVVHRADILPQSSTAAPIASASAAWSASRATGGRPACAARCRGAWRPSAGAQSEERTPCAPYIDRRRSGVVGQASSVRAR